MPCPISRKNQNIKAFTLEILHHNYDAYYWQQCMIMVLTCCIRDLVSRIMFDVDCSSCRIAEGAVGLPLWADPLGPAPFGGTFFTGGKSVLPRYWSMLRSSSNIVGSKPSYSAGAGSLCCGGGGFLLLSSVS